MNKSMLALAGMFFVSSFHHDICAAQNTSNPQYPSSSYYSQEPQNPAFQQNPNSTIYNPSAADRNMQAPSNHYYPTTGQNPASYNTYQKNTVPASPTVLPNATEQAKPAQPTTSPRGTILAVANNDGAISTFLGAVQSVNLNEILDRPGPYTIFAPSNEAFKKLSPETLSNLLAPENKEKLREILKNHIIPSKLNATDLKEVTLYSIDGKPIAIKVVGKEITVNGAKISKTDIVGSNGVIHLIDTVLVPKN